MRRLSQSRRVLTSVILAASVSIGISCTSFAVRSDASAAGSTTLRVVGFQVAPSEKGTPLDKAYLTFLATFHKTHPNVTIQSLPTPPDFDTQLIVDLASHTAPDLWQQDASTLAPLIHDKYVLDMRQCLKLVPQLNLSRFFPTVLAIHRQPNGAIYDLPNDFTPMVIYYNPLAFKRAHVSPPSSTWTWEELRSDARRLTLDNKGRNALDPHFDAQHVVQWGFRVRKYTFEWIYRVWENGSDVISPDGKTASGYLDAPKTIQALQFLKDLVLKDKVAPKPSALDQMTQSLGFDDLFLKGQFSMFDRGHWELVGLQASNYFKPAALAVVEQPKEKNNSTVIYESSWAIPSYVTGDKLKAACQFVEAATSRQYQDTKVITGIAIAANKASAEAAVAKSRFPAIERTFIQAVAHGRAPYGARYAKWPTVEKLLDSMMERILAGGSVKREVATTVSQINRQLQFGR